MITRMLKDILSNEGAELYQQRKLLDKIFWEIDFQKKKRNILAMKDIKDTLLYTLTRMTNKKLMDEIFRLSKFCDAATRDIQGFNYKKAQALSQEQVKLDIERVINEAKSYVSIHGAKNINERLTQRLDELIAINKVKISNDNLSAKNALSKLEDLCKNYQRILNEPKVDEVK
jgi:hypothetical protein